MMGRNNIGRLFFLADHPEGRSIPEILDSLG